MTVITIVIIIRCETLLPFMCQIQACPRGSKHCSNGQCVNDAYFCDGQNDCGDGSDELNCEAQCTKHMNQLNSGQVESPGLNNGNGRYPQFANCKWTLEGPPGTNIVLQVGFILKSSFIRCSLLKLTLYKVNDRAGCLFESAAKMILRLAMMMRIIMTISKFNTRPSQAPHHTPPSVS